MKKDFPKSRASVKPLLPWPCCHATPLPRAHQCPPPTPCARTASPEHCSPIVTHQTVVVCIEFCRSMLLTLFSAHKLSSTLSETGENMRDMPMRQTLCSPIPQGRDAWTWVLISAIVGRENGCKIWAWVCLSLSLLPMPPKTPFLLSLGALTPAMLQGPSEWIPIDESELFGSQIPPTVQLYLRTSAHLFS